ncbi:lipid-A-disaccharide kinase [Orbus hercynius]|uniref:Tetraacyldisaccharide 4'-kinase n=1 Tax=Orbus hercynius TaxID=593135 RepID=A0A495RKJ3_9GAMM|nr:tetraacyldisaccharide 4'-kinase [Orbus hercynius]RKS87851.1 lipid-A-disaccharide kinase [Orbus hercynius]
MIAKLWSGENKLYWLLVPFSLLYGLIVFMRKKLYQLGLFKSWKAPIPVIVVGNLSAGGNGKTPVVIYLVEQLIARGYRVGVVSRGYGGKSDRYPVIVTKDTPATVVGDEPVLVYQRTRVPFAVSPDRTQAVQVLLDNYTLDVIITDDGLQHYALQRDIEIVVIDGKRGFGNGWYLPAGPMRESVSRLSTVDFTVINGANERHYLNAYSMQLVPHDAVNILTHERKSVQELKSVWAIAGIGDPNRFFAMLKNQQVDLINTTGFADHQQYSKEQLSVLVRSDQILLMTEKDAVKCVAFAEENWWYLPIEAKLTDEFIENLQIKIAK